MRDGLTIALQLIGASLALLVLVGAIGYVLRGPLERFAMVFIGRYGLVAMGFGTLLADAISFPVPPQFYMLASVVSGTPAKPALIAIGIGSLVGGTIGYFLAGRLSQWRWVAGKLERSRKRVDKLVDKYGYWAVAIASFTPVPFSILCYLSGLYRLRWHHFGVVLALRLPRLAVYYAIVRAGWLSTAG
jgi:membrane protein YqaA with SNARE-associated domain